MHHSIPWECKSTIWLLHKQIASGCKHEKSIVSCPTYSIRGCMKKGEPIKAVTNNVMMKSASHSYRRYKAALEENKRKQTDKKWRKK